MKARTVLALLLFCFCLPFPAKSQTDDRRGALRASLASIPGLINSPEDGPFVDLVKAIAAETGQPLSIKMFPMARSINNVVEGYADFHVPTIRNRKLDESRLPYAFTSESYGTVSFVIYSNDGERITREMIEEAVSRKAVPFPYVIEVPAGMEGLFPFPCQPSNDVERSLRKVQKKRIDALVWAQEEVDLALRKSGIKDIRREHWEDMEDTIVVQKSERGKKMDRLLSAAIRGLRKSGKLDAIYPKVHKPFVPWQPADTD